MSKLSHVQLCGRMDVTLSTKGHGNNEEPVPKLMAQRLFCYNRMVSIELVRALRGLTRRVATSRAACCRMQDRVHGKKAQPEMRSFSAAISAIQ